MGTRDFLGSRRPGGARFREDVGSSTAETERTSRGALSPARDFSGMNVEEEASGG